MLRASPRERSGRSGDAFGCFRLFGVVFAEATYVLEALGNAFGRFCRLNGCVGLVFGVPWNRIVFGSVTHRFGSYGAKLEVRLARLH